MLPRLALWNVALASILGSWFSWNKHFRWALEYIQIKALWLLFRSANYRWLLLNFILYMLAWPDCRLLGLEVNSAEFVSLISLVLGIMLLSIQYDSLLL